MRHSTCSRASQPSRCPRPAAQESVSRPACIASSSPRLSEGGNFSSQVVGLDVYNDDRQYVGQIEDIAMNQDGQTQAYVLSVGGMLGMGEHYVAVLHPQSR